MKPGQIIAIIVTSPVWLAALAIVIPFVIFGGLLYGVYQLLIYALTGEWDRVDE